MVCKILQKQIMKANQTHVIAFYHVKSTASVTQRQGRLASNTSNVTCLPIALHRHAAVVRVVREFSARSCSTKSAKTSLL